MAVLQTILTITFIIASVFLVFLILIQSSRSSGMGLFGGGGASQTAFGSSSGDILTRITGILAAVFLLMALTLAFMKNDPADKERIKRVIQETISKKKSKSAASQKKDDKPASDTSTATKPDEANTDQSNSPQNP